MQFILVLIHSSQLLWLKDCSYPKLFVYLIGLYAGMFLVMFAHFYIQAYRKKPINKSDHNANLSNGKSHNGIVTNGVKTD